MSSVRYGSTLRVSFGSRRVPHAGQMTSTRAVTGRERSSRESDAPPEQRWRTLTPGALAKLPRPTPGPLPFRTGGVQNGPKWH